MAGKRKHEIAEIKKAIAGSGGNIKLIADRLGCGRPTVYRYLKQYPELKETFAAEDGLVEGRPHFPKEKFEKAIEGCNGILKVVANRVGCSRATVENYFDLYPDLRQQFADSRMALVDTAESVVVDTLGDTGNPKLRFAAARYITGTLGKDRGWAERRELTGADGQNLFSVPEDVAVAAEAIGLDLAMVWQQFLGYVRAKAANNLTLNSSPKGEGLKSA